MRLRTFLLLTAAAAFSGYQIHRLVSYFVNPSVEIIERWDDEEGALSDEEAERFQGIVDNYEQQGDE